MKKRIFLLSFLFTWVLTSTTALSHAQDDLLQHCQSKFNPITFDIPTGWYIVERTKNAIHIGNLSEPNLDKPGPVKTGNILIDIYPALVIDWLEYTEPATNSLALGMLVNYENVYGMPYIWRKSGEKAELIYTQRPHIVKESALDAAQFEASTALHDGIVGTVRISDQQILFYRAQTPRGEMRKFRAIVLTFAASLRAKLPAPEPTKEGAAR